MDRKLFGGFNRGELNIFAGGSGAGKSLFLANLGVNFALAGLNVVYLTLELSEALVSMRIDSMVTGVSTREIFKNLDDIEMKVKMIGKKSGMLQVKYMPSGKTVNDIRAYLKEYEIKCGKKVDVLLVDYMDLLMPIGKKISAENLFVKDKYVSEELRNLAMEKQCVFVTAAQLNRGAVEEVEFDHSHISGGLSKIQTADNVIGIFTSRAMRERGRYQLQLMKTRSSSGVGQKIDLEFNIETLKISDLPEDEQEGNGATNRGSSSLIDSIKRKTNLNADADGVISDDPSQGVAVGKVRAHVESTKLREILNSMGGDEDE
jgi:replicative DNA helicase